MNKKIIKTIAGITCGLGIASSIPFATTSCGCSNKKVSLYNIPSLDSLLNFNPTQYINFCLDPNKDYTNGNPDIKVMDPDYIDYIKRITNDMFKEENFEKTKDFLAFFVASYSIHLLKAYTVGDSAELPVEEFSNVLKQTVKNFYLKISPISNFKYIGEKKGYDWFTFSCTSQISFILMYEGQPINCKFNTTITNQECYLQQFNFKLDADSQSGGTNGIYDISLKSESKDFCKEIWTIGDESLPSSHSSLNSIGIFPSLPWLDLVKDLQLSKDAS